MARFLKDLKIANGQEGKVLTLDENGKIISSDKDVSELADTNITNNLDSRVTELETAVGDIGQRLSALNG